MPMAAGPVKEPKMTRIENLDCPICDRARYHVKATKVPEVIQEGLSLGYPLRPDERSYDAVYCAICGDREIIDVICYEEAAETQCGWMGWSLRTGMVVHLP